MLLTKLQQELLIFGYVRSNYISYIPVVLMETCRWFYNETFCHTITYKTIPDFLSRRNGEKMYSAVFNVHGIPMYCILAPNGTVKEEEGFVQFMVQLDKNQENISSVVIQVHMFCDLYLTKFWHLDSAVLRLNNCAGWNPKHWALSSVQLFYDTYKSDLNFYCHINVLEIQYTNEKVPVRINSYGHNISLKHSYEYEIDIFLDQIAEMSDVQYFLFNDRNLAFGISTVPDCKENNEYYLGLRLYRLPQNISKISVKATICVTHKNMKRRKTYSLRFQFSYKNYQTVKNILFELEDSLEKVGSINVKVYAKIMTAWDLKNKIISKKNWNKYGIN